MLKFLWNKIWKKIACIGRLLTLVIWIQFNYRLQFSRAHCICFSSNLTYLSIPELNISLLILEKNDQIIFLYINVLF